jgi:hypothetical protein
VRHPKAEGPDAVTATIGPQADQQSERISLTPISQDFDTQRTGARARANAYAALNVAGDYLDQAQNALRAGDDSQARSSLEVLFAIVAVALKTIAGECLPNTSEQLQ